MATQQQPNSINLTGSWHFNLKEDLNTNSGSNFVTLFNSYKEEWELDVAFYSAQIQSSSTELTDWFNEVSTWLATNNVSDNIAHLTSKVSEVTPDMTESEMDALDIVVPEIEE